MCVARIEPLPGSASPSASVRQFIEFAVNMPEHEPHVGQAASSSCAMSSSVTSSATASAIAVIRLTRVRTVPSTSTAVPPSIGPPDTNTVGMSNRSAAMSIPAVILSQFEMHTSASATSDLPDRRDARPRCVWPGTNCV